MIILSNNLLGKDHFPIPAHVVIRVNVAWVKTMEELEHILQECTHDIYLDYPQGRSKPPRPTLNLEEVIQCAHRFPNVKYFAVSNVEDPHHIHAIKVRLPARVDLIPKIETKKGIKNLEQIIEKIAAKYIMLDKEDLYVDIARDAALFDELIALARKKTERAGAQVLELEGVVFGIYTPTKKAAVPRRASARMSRNKAMPRRAAAMRGS